jgi:hypothetical protein
MIRSDKMPFQHVESYESNMSSVSATSSEIAYVQDCRMEYEAAESLEELKRLNIAFLRGEKAATAYHFGPLMPESAPLKEKLVALNELDFLTTNSQPGCSFHANGKKYEQRFYVEGVLPRKYLAMFLQRMYSKCPTVFLYILEKEFTYDEVQMLQEKDLYWVTKTDKIGVTHIPEIAGPCEMFQTCETVFPELVDEYMSILIMDTRWCHEGTEILDTTLSVLQELQDIPNQIALKKARLSVPTFPKLTKV